MPVPYTLFFALGPGDTTHAPSAFKIARNEVTRLPSLSTKQQNQNAVDNQVWSLTLKVLNSLEKTAIPTDKMEVRENASYIKYVNDTFDAASLETVTLMPDSNMPYSNRKKTEASFIAPFIGFRACLCELLNPRYESPAKQDVLKDELFKAEWCPPLTQRPAEKQQATPTHIDLRFSQARGLYTFMKSLRLTS